jgi:hypothetical protein
MLIARDGGCTKPCCTVGAYGSQVHHALTDWAQGGLTNVDEMALACGPDNRLVHTDGGYTTTLTDTGEVAWHPPPALDHGQARINYYHRPELLLTPPEHTPHPKPGRDAQRDPQWDAEREAAREPDPQPKPDPQPQPQPQCQPEPQCQPRRDADRGAERDPQDEPERDPQPQTDLQCQPRRDADSEPQRDSENAADRGAERESEDEPDCDTGEDVDWDRGSILDWGLESVLDCDPESILQPDHATTLDWDPEWDNMSDQPTPIPPDVEDLSIPEPSDQCIPLNWIPLNAGPPATELDSDTYPYDYPDPRQATATNYAHGGKGVRGP